jgi:3-deoxy-D-manno-octulosonic-acid transferase
MILFVIYVIVAPILWPFIFISSFFIKKLEIRRKNTWESILNVRRGIRNNRSERKVIIFHAASNGEFEQLVPVLKLIDRKQFYIIISLFSSSVFLKQKQTPLADGVCFHPYDFLFSSFLFFKMLNPHQYIVVRHDIWPAHLFMARLFNVKTILINANLYSESSRLKSPFLIFNQWVFKHFNLILTPSKRITESFKKLVPHTETYITGDSRFDQLILRKNNNQQPSVLENTSNAKTIIFGSIDKTDYDIIFKTLKQFYPKGDESLNEKANKLIFVPHEVDNRSISELISMLKELDFDYTLYSQNKISKANLVIVDSVGILADLYKHSDLAYIGGGFGKEKYFGQSGVHSVIEPCAYGLISCFGPNINILDEAVEMVEKGIGFIVENQADFMSCFAFLEDDKFLRKLKQKTEEYLSFKSGASNKIINYIG